MKPNKILFTVLVLLAALACKRETEMDYADFDKNSDGMIDREEFKDVFTANYYDDWNVDDDEYLDDEDFYTSTYAIWDADNDEQLTEEEWTMGYDYYYGDYIVDDFETLDADRDGYIGYTEYSDALANTEFYGSWNTDANETISEEELAEGVFSRWDADNSGFLEEDEFTSFDRYYLDI